MVMGFNFRLASFTNIIAYLCIHFYHIIWWRSKGVYVELIVKALPTSGKIVSKLSFF